MFASEQALNHPALLLDAEHFNIIIIIIIITF